MTRRPGSGLTLLLGALVAGGVEAACVRLAAHPHGEPLARFEVGGEPPGFAISYVHSVTQTPVKELYRIDGTTIVQTEIRFAQHGPGLPTEADAGGRWRREAGGYVVTTARRMDAIVLRVNSQQRWRLELDGDPEAVELARWGDRALALSARPGTCLSEPTGSGGGAR